MVVDLDDWADLADRKIKEAQAAGHFDNLPGLGKPLQLYDNPLEGEWALAHRILRNANISPPWIALQQQVQRRGDDLRARLAQVGRQLHDRHQRLLALPTRNVCVLPSDCARTAPPSEHATCARRRRWTACWPPTMRRFSGTSSGSKSRASRHSAPPRSSTRPAHRSMVCSNIGRSGRYAGEDAERTSESSKVISPARVRCTGQRTAISRKRAT